MNPPEQLAKCLLEGDHEASWEIIKIHISEGASALDLFEGLITRAMQHVGVLWENNEITVADEHLATSTCDYILSKYQYYMRENKPEPEAHKKAMFLCVQDEDHYIGLKMVHILFEENGWQTKFMGPNLPLEFALSAAEKWKPEVIGLSFSLNYRAGQLKEYISRLESIQTNPTVLLGGRLLLTHDFTQFGSEKTRFIPTLTQLAEWFDLERSGGTRFVK
ncbi:B12-binding domain-containing protein [Metabacillus sp. KIGAM252]|uniref:B12-binding domain-containing protein n=1 Tax=Metabacillus flavus TaxID=2823519 RepID=A0ABS5LAI1_9BACI|nr:B12-binding domain-containing protein [Metabacillus flavus]MBS2967725.1 B12-binding domain-containing protein [Metabacillus flavus]